MFDSVTMNALSSALDGLALRQRTIAQNVANVNTPIAEQNTRRGPNRSATQPLSGTNTASYVYDSTPSAAAWATATSASIAASAMWGLRRAAANAESTRVRPLKDG